MKRICLLALLALLTTTGTHASTVSTGGTVTFHGSIQRSTMSLPQNRHSDNPNLGITTSALPLSKARTLLSSDVLDYFASYAKPDAKLVSSTYR
jgi:hypothetical protein